MIILNEAIVELNLAVTVVVPRRSLPPESFADTDRELPGTAADHDDVDQGIKTAFDRSLFS